MRRQAYPGIREILFIYLFYFPDILPDRMSGNHDVRRVVLQYKTDAYYTVRIPIPLEVVLVLRTVLYQ